VADRQRSKLIDMPREEGIAADHKPACSQLDQLCKDRIEVTFGAGAEDMKFQPESLGRRQGHTRLELGKKGLAGLMRSAMTRAEGSNSCSNSSRFGNTSSPNWVTPVTLPPGRLRLATKPSLTGSAAVSKIIGTVVVAAFAASAAGVLVATITAT